MGGREEDNDDDNDDDKLHFYSEFTNWLDYLKEKRGRNSTAIAMEHANTAYKKTGLMITTISTSKHNLTPRNLIQSCTPRFHII